VEGELDMHVAEDFRQTVDDALDSSGVKNVLLSLKGVTFIDSSGLGVILGRYKKVYQLGGKVLAAHAHPQVERIFRLSGLLKLIQIYNSENQALESL
jgi:stage II sporulation protein AA (anti-sigma F factor antagonist)